MEWGKELEKKILESNDKILFSESIKCINTGCLRAGYIVAWLSIVESFKSKLALLSGMGEKAAELAVKRIDVEENAGRSVDKIILDEAKKCNLIDEMEFDKLLFLWKERCKFAHPYQIAPRAFHFHSPK